MKRLAVATTILALLLAGAILWWKISLSPVNSADKSPQSFVVTSGDSVRDVAKRLKDQNLIRDQVAYFLILRLGLEKGPQAGNFSLNRTMAATEIAKVLTRGTDDVKVTIPEGWRSEQIVESLQKQGFAGPVGNWNEEGKYFPETYFVPKTMTIDQIRVLMRQTFDKKVSNLTENQLILASLIEREARVNGERPVIVGILLNRLEAGIALDVDATVQYAIGFTKTDGWWKKELTLEDLKIKSPYNTYINPGLPPGPIANPGLAAINAVLNPVKTDYLFYLHDSSGSVHYAKTLEEHNANVAKYL